MTQWQSPLVVKETVLSTEFKIFTICPLLQKFADLCSRGDRNTKLQLCVLVLLKELAILKQK